MDHKKSAAGSRASGSCIPVDATQVLFPELPQTLHNALYNHTLEVLCIWQPCAGQPRPKAMLASRGLRHAELYVAAAATQVTDTQTTI